MGTLPPDELLRLWAAEELPTERAIGQVVQHVALLQAAFQRQSQTIAELQAEVGRLRGATASTATALPRRKAG